MLIEEFDSRQVRKIFPMSDWFIKLALLYIKKVTIFIYASGLNVERA